MNSEYVNMEEDMPIRNERQMVISSTGQLANPDGGSTNAFQALMRARKGLLDLIKKSFRKQFDTSTFHLTSFA